MIKKILICMVIFPSIIIAMEERESKQTEARSTTTEEGAFNIIAASYLDKLPIEIRKKIEDYLLFETFPIEIKELIAKSLVNAVTNEADALKLRENLRNLSQVNREFRLIVKSESFIKYAINTLNNRLGRHVIYAAVLLATPEVAQWLKKQNPNVGVLNQFLYERTRKGDFLGVRFLLDVGGNLQKLDGVQALATAAEFGHEKLVKLLLTKEPRQISKDFALIEAISFMQQNVGASEEEVKNIVQILIAGGANVNATCALYWSALMAAKHKNLNEVAKMLEEAGAKE